MYKITRKDGQELLRSLECAGRAERQRRSNYRHACQRKPKRCPASLATALQIARACFPILLATAALLSLTACQRKPTFVSFGWQIVEADGAPEQVAGALYATRDEFADWKTDADGKRSDPSFAEHGRSWKSEHGPETAIAETRFRAKGGAEIVMTRISIKGRPLLIYFNTTDTETGMNLHNMFVSNLVKNGIKPKTPWMRNK
jgi:hypothetical protein